MARHVCVFEDNHFRDFFPLTLTRSVHLMRAGILPQFERIRRVLRADRLTLMCRSQAAPLMAEQVPDCPVNIIKRGDDDLLLVNGRIRDFGDLEQKLADVRFARGFEVDGELAALILKREMLEPAPAVASHEDYHRLIAELQESIPRHTTTATLYRRPWEFVEDIDRAVGADFRLLEPEFGAPRGVIAHDGAYFVNENDVYLGDRVEVLPGAVIDASKGPVYIGAGSRVEPHALVAGPTFIGANSVVLAGKISASSIGAVCRVGGEIEESVFQGFVNKYHAGFIGHSYVGQWVNFGAMTTNSDLKNNYSTIRVSIDGETVDSGSIKVGSFIGDHTKFGIGTLLNTGIAVGVCCNIFGGSLVADKEVPSFRWGGTGNWSDYRFDKAVETAKRTTERRNVRLSEREIELLRSLAAGQISSEGTLNL